MTCECNNSSEIPCTMLLLYRYFFHRISAKFYVDLSATFLNFQYSSGSSYFVNLMTPQNLPAYVVTLQGCSSHGTLGTLQYF